MKYERLEITLLKCSWCEKYLGNLSGCQYYFDGKDDYYCPDCALKLGIIDALEWMRSQGYPDDFSAAYYHDDVIEVVVKPEKIKKYGYAMAEYQIFDADGNRIYSQGVEKWTL